MKSIKILVIILVVITVSGLLASVASSGEFQVVYVRSLDQPCTETVITVKNNGNTPRTVLIQWFDQSNALTGWSGPLVLNPMHAADFTTATGGAIQPYTLDAFRLGAMGDFEGYARVFYTGADNTMGVNATLVIGINPFTNLGSNYTSLKVTLRQGNNGD